MPRLGLVGILCCMWGSAAQAADVELLCTGQFKTMAEMLSQAPGHPVPSMKIMLFFSTRQALLQSDAFPMFQNGYVAEILSGDATSIDFYSKRVQRTNPSLRYLGAHLSRTTGDVVITISEGGNDGLALTAKCRPAAQMF